MQKGLILLALFFIVRYQGFTQNFSWAGHIAGASGDEGVSNIAVDAAGNLYITGSFESVVDFDPGPGTFNLTSVNSRDAFVAKYSSAGAFIWAKQFGGSGRQEPFSITVDGSGNVYTTGRFTGTADFDPGPGVFNLVNPSFSLTDIFFSKLDMNGNFAWAKQIGGSQNNEGHDIVTDATGHIYTTGFFSGTVDFDPGPGTVPLTAADNDIFISKLDAGGNHVWSRNMGGNGADDGFRISADATGNVLAGGWFTGTADFDPGPGTFNMVSAGNADIFLCQINSSGNFGWAKQIGGTGNDRVRSIARDGSGNIYLTGSFTGTADFDPGTPVFNLVSAGFDDIFICKLTNTGNFTWAKQIGGPSGDNGYSIKVTSGGDIYFGGTFSLSVDFDPGPGTFILNAPPSNFYNSFISKLDANGGFVWALHFAGSFYNYIAGIGIDITNNIYAGGLFYQTVDFDPGPGTTNYTSQFDNDIFILKLANVITGTPSPPAPLLAKIFPNPANLVLFIEMPGMFDYNLYHFSGRLLSSEKNYTKRAEINTSLLPKGIYMLEIITKKTKEAHKLVVE